MASIPFFTAIHAHGFDLIGMIEPNDVVEVGTQVPGILEEVLVERGDKVEEGQVIARIKSGVEKAAVELARARVEFGKRKAERNEDLYQKQLVSIHEKDELETEIQLTELQLQEALERLDLRTVRSPIKGIVIKAGNKGIYVIEDNSEYLIIKVAAGEIWDDFVQFCTDKNYYGAENLSLIPGSVGASAVQNIGAYGVEAKDIIFSVEAVDFEGNIVNFLNYDCNFYYRDSIFKNKYKGKYIITSVSYKLLKNSNFKTDYGNIKPELQKFETINLKNLRQAIINIRNSKLPKPEELPNAGSFFKNPVISAEKYKELKTKFPELVSYPFGEKMKLAAGHLIDISAEPAVHAFL